MGLPREETLTGTAAELARFEAMVRPMTAIEWQAPTRCGGWAIGDVAAHVTGTIADIATGRLVELAAPDAPARQVAERRGRSPRDVADELQEATLVVSDIAAGFDDAAWSGPAPAGIPGTLGEGIEAIWYDAYVHAEDIRSALGRPRLGLTSRNNASAPPARTPSPPRCSQHAINSCRSFWEPPLRKQTPPSPLRRLAGHGRPAHLRPGGHRPAGRGRHGTRSQRQRLRMKGLR